MSRLRALSLAAAALAMATGEAAACPACATDSGAWFRYTTVILSLVPLALIGGVVWWIRRQVAGGAGDSAG